MTNSTDLGPAITLYTDVLPDSKLYIDLVEKYSDWRPGLIHDGDTEYRVSSIWSVNPRYADADVWNSLSDKLIELGNSYAVKNHMPHAKMQGLQLIKYEPGEGFYNWHYDVSYSETDDDSMKSRVFSMVAYLNDVPSGGETEFKNFDLLVGPKTGSVLMFPANFAYIHRANKPKDVPKYIVVTWFQY
jgi:prolyl 4-hydroxylase